MAKPKLTEEEKAKREAEKNTPEGLKAQLVALRKKEADMVLKVAIASFPALKETIATVASYENEVKKIDTALGKGGEGGVEKQLERLDKMIAHYEKKIEELKKERNEVNPSTVLEALKDNRGKALINLKKAVLAAAPQFAAAGVEIGDVLPGIADLQDDLDATVIPAAAEAVVETAKTGEVVA